MSSELGRLNQHELFAQKPGGWDDEIGERLNAYRYGAPNRHALLSRAQVVEVAPPMAHNQAGYGMGWNACREAYSRALLALKETDPSPLED